MIQAALGPYRLAFEPDHGGLASLGLRDRPDEALAGPSAPDLDLRTDAGWLLAGGPPRLEDLEVQEGEVRRRLRLGGFAVEDRIRLDGPFLRRRVRVEWRGRGEVRLLGVRLWLRGAGIPPLEGCTFDSPTNPVRPRCPLSLAARQPLDGPFDAAFAPGARGRWGRALEDAPDVSPGLFLIHQPQRALSLLAWYVSDVEAATPRLASRDGRSLDLVHEVGLAGWMGPGTALEGGDQWLGIVPGGRDGALAAYRASLPRTGLAPRLGPPPAWVRRGAIYEVHPGPFGGFAGLTREIPRLARMGITVLYLLPIWRYDNRTEAPWDEDWLGSGSPYAIRDYEAWDPSLGTEEELRELVATAHRHGMRVLLDFVAQGCARDARYVTEHPEWFCRDPEGNLVSSHGWTDTYSFDWANPDFQAYMLSWSLELVERLGIDGYRVDAPHGKEPNWARGLPYHASATNLGVVRLLDRLQEGVKARKPDGALLCELFGPLFLRNHDFAYDYRPVVMLYELFQQRLTPDELARWMADYWAVLPETAVRVAFVETHDTRRFQPPALPWRGSLASRAIFAYLAFAGFVPMVWAGQERGQEDFYARVLKARAGSEALLSGERLFAPAAVGPAPGIDRARFGEGDRWVLQLGRRRGRERLWSLTQLWPEKVPLAFRLDREAWGLTPAARYRLTDRLTGQVLAVVPGETLLRGWTFSPEPYRPYWLALEEG